VIRTASEEEGMNVDDFREMYVAELQELHSVEDQLVQALPKMAELVQNPQLKEAIRSHLDETRSQRDRLDDLLRRHGADVREHQDGSMQAILREGERWAKMVSDPDLRDAGVIASAQRVEHYEIAVYGTLATWAKQLGLSQDQQTLHDILEQEKRADEKLTELAKRVVNPEAAHA
jgi:ferritin-like metal-binding protein YciE